LTSKKNLISYHSYILYGVDIDPTTTTTTATTTAATTAAMTATTTIATTSITTAASINRSNHFSFAVFN